MNVRAWWARLETGGLEMLLALMLAAVAVFGVLLPILGIAGPTSVDSREVDLTGATEVPGAAGSGAVTVRGTEIGELVLADPDLWKRLLLVLPGVATALLAMVLLELLRRLAKTFREGDSFVPQNFRRVNGVALAVLLIGTAVPLLEMVTTMLLVTGTPVESKVLISYELSGAWLVAGIMIYAAAGAFGHGTRLRADTEGLV
jgi:hypothetical protein